MGFDRPIFLNRFAAAVAAHPEATAIAGAGESVTYEGLEERGNALAEKLASNGVEPGSLVAVCIERSIDQIATLLGIWKAGCAFLPLDPAWPEQRLVSLVADAGCATVISSFDPSDRFARHAPTPGTVGGAEGLAYVIYTSGSTGGPKGVEVSHENLAALIDWHNAAFEVGHGTRTSHLAGLGFDASQWEVWPTLAAGGTLVLADDATRVDAVRLRDWLVVNEVEVSFAPTALAEPLVAMSWPSNTRLRVLLTGADRLTRRPARGLPFRFVNNYGPTESTVVATSGVIAAEGEGLPSIGKAIVGTEIHLLDEARQSVAAGETGELYIGGAQVARGYRGDPALTAERFVNHPQFGRLYRTGDLARERADGDLDFCGRVDAQVKVRGHRVEPAEIAGALNRLPEVSSSAVIARDGGLVAYVVPAQGVVPTATALRAALSESLPDYMVPGRFCSLPALPLTANGKLDPKALPDPATCAMAEANASRAPSTPTEKRLLGIVSDVIGRSDIGVDDDFFLLGGHSLLGTQVVVRARDAFGVDLTLFQLFEGRTVARLAEMIENLALEKLASMSDEDIRRAMNG